MKIPLKGIPLNNFPKPDTVATNPAELMQAMRYVRAFMLAESDWTQVPDSPLDDKVKEQWRNWRQELRDLTKEITIFTVTDFFEVSDPPSKGLPTHWAIWETGFEPLNKTYNDNQHNHNDSTHDVESAHGN